MIPTALREQIVKHQEQDEKLRPAQREGGILLGGVSPRFGVELGGAFLSEETAADLITMAYLERLAEMARPDELELKAATAEDATNTVSLPGAFGRGSWLAAAVAAYEAVKEKQDE